MRLEMNLFTTFWIYLQPDHYTHSWHGGFYCTYFIFFRGYAMVVDAVPCTVRFYILSGSHYMVTSLARSVLRP